MSVVCALLERESDPAKAADAIASQDYVLTIGARERGYTIYDRYVDAGISGEVRDRPALLRLLADAEERRFSVVLATELSRLTRGGLADYFILKSELGRYGVRLEFLAGADHADDGTSEIGPILEAFEATVPLVEKRAIQRRTSAGKLRVWSEGFHWSGWAPYGYRYVAGGRAAGHWAVVTAEAEVVLRIFRMATEGYSLHAIARALVQDGVPTRRGGRWWGSTISAIIGNPRYKGTFVSCRYQAVLPKGPYRPRAGGTVRRRPKTSVILRPESEWQGAVEIPELAIVSPELWAEANRLRAINRQTSPRRAREPSLLHGLVWCEFDHRDGRPRKMAFKAPRRQRPLWRCTWEAQPGGPYCAGHHVAADLEELVWAKLVALARAPERVLASMASGLKEMGERRGRAAALLAGAEAELLKAQQTLDALTVRWLSGDIADDQYRRLQPALEAAAQAALSTREEAAAQVHELEQGLAFGPDSTGLEGLARLVRHAFAHGRACDGHELGADERRREIKRVVERIVVGPEGPAMVVALTGQREALVNTAW